MSVVPFPAKPHVWARSDQWKTMLYEYSGDTLVYAGAAPPGTPTEIAAWQIRKFSFDGTNLTGVAYAQGDSDYAFAWDNRASYTYS